MSESTFIHPTADVQSVTVGSGTRIWQFCVVLPGAEIGADCNICAHCFIENGVVIGDRVTIKSGVQLWDGLHLEDGVFVGPNATFTNDKFPRSQHHLDSFAVTTISKGASVGANATILPGVTIGAGAMVGAGAVVTKSVPANAIVSGNPAEIRGYVDAPDMRASAGVAEGDAVGDLKVAGASLHTLKHVSDLRGELCAAELGDGLPFQANRFFFVYDVPGDRARGGHAHLTCHQFLVCVRGSVKVAIDDGELREETVLRQPSVGLWLEPGVWAAQYDYSADAVLLVAASHSYDEDDYIRDYEAFLAWKAANSSGRQAQ